MLEKPNFNNEFRLGLVLYGGVSLAIYMNGICREFYNAVRGRGIYKLIKALTDSDIVVDIISGTSAGGINGVLLSYALTNSNQDKVIDFDQFADIWRNTGDINKLMREVDRPNSQEEVNSVLDGEGYYQDQLCKAFETGGNKRSKAPQGEWYSDFRELDLFVTGTDILGKISTEFDHNSKLIEIKNHRVVFHLQHRRDRREDKYTPFKPNDKITSEALAKLCRITSCFPLAFPVVTVKLKEKESDTTLVDKKLVEWGQLEERQLPAKPPEKTGYQLHFVDGGVLDNRPFSYTTEAIYYRSAYRPVSRKLLYIDPNPESFLGSPEFQVMAKPNIWETVKDSLISLPSYESIGQDLQRIKEGNRKIRRYNNLRRIITQQIQPSSTESQPNKSLEHKRYLQCRFLGIVDRILSLIITTDTQSESARQKQEKNLEETAKLLTKYISEELDEEVYKIAEKILNLDVQYAMRKHKFILNEISHIFQKNQETDDLQLRYLTYQLSWQIEILKIIKEGLAEILPSVSEKIYQIIEDSKNNKIPEDIFKDIFGELVSIYKNLLNSDNYKNIYQEWQKQLRTITIDEFSKASSPKQTLSEQLVPLLEKVFEKIKEQKNN